MSFFRDKVGSCTLERTKKTFDVVFYNGTQYHRWIHKGWNGIINGTTCPNEIGWNFNCGFSYIVTAPPT